MFWLLWPLDLPAPPPPCTLSHSCSLLTHLADTLPHLPSSSWPRPVLGGARDWSCFMFYIACVSRVISLCWELVQCRMRGDLGMGFSFWNE